MDEKEIVVTDNELSSDEYMVDGIKVKVERVFINKGKSMIDRLLIYSIQVI